MAIRTAQFQFSKTLIPAFLLALVIAAPFAAPGVAAEAVEHKKVLMLFSDDAFIATQVMMERALRSTLRSGSPVPVETYSEYVSNKLAGADYEKELVALLRRKYAGKKFDAVFSIGSYPIGMSIRNRDDLFPGTPIVFLSIDQRNIANFDHAPGVTGIWGEINFKPNLELALTLHPGTKRVVMIQGVSEADKFWATKAKEDFREYESRLEFSDLSGLTIPEMRNALAALPPDTLVFFVSNIQDKAGNTYESPDYLRQIEAASAAPIYGTTDGQLGNGIVGGRLLSFDALGTEAGQLGLRLLAGEKPESISPHLVPSSPIFDWRQLRRWDISDSSLPAGSVIQFRQPTIWEEYKWYAIGLLATLTLETILIGLLLYLRLRRRQAEAKTTRINSRLGEIVANVPGIVWESRTDPATNLRRTTFISDYVQRMLGYTPDEWLKKPSGFGLQIVPEEDRERVLQESDEIIETGEDAVSEYRWFTKDGQIRWVENHLAPIVDEENGVVGLRGVALDITDRKLAEERARQTEERNTSIVTAIPDLMFVVSQDGVYVDYHANDPEVLLVPPEVFLGKNIRDVLPPEVAEELFRSFERVSEDAGPQIVEFKLPLERGDRWYEARTVRAGENFLSVVRDITDRKEAEAELSFQARMLNTVEQAAIATDPNGTVFYWNAFAEKLYGWSVEEAVGSNINDLLISSNSADQAAKIWAQLREGQSWVGEFTVTLRDGRVIQIWVNDSPIYNEQEELVGILGISHDITERKAAEEALREREERFRNMAETAPVTIWMSDEKQATTYISKQWREITGSTLEDNVKFGWSSYVHPEDLDLLSETYTTAFQNRIPFKVEFRVRRTDGEYRWILGVGAPRLTAEGTFLGYIGSAIDITDRKQSESDLREAHEELQKLKNQLEAENIYLQEELRKDRAFGDMVGQSAAIKYVLFKVSQVAPTDATVLIAGETGTGKELIARAIHDASPRRDWPLIKVNCAALSPSLIESELFGHEKGAFTGAAGRKMGRFELADRGTLLLDEIGELPLDLQAKLLRVLQEGEFERVGSGVTIKADVRVIALTNRDLKQDVEKGRFREDLWYRLNVFPITTPPLRDRRDDIPLLTDHFAILFSRKFGKEITAVSPNAMNALCNYSWPGNVRELANVIERAVINSHGPILRINEDFSARQAEISAATVKTLEEMERDYITGVLEDLNWRIDGPQGVARILGVNPSTLRTRMAKLGIQKPSPKNSNGSN